MTGEFRDVGAMLAALKPDEPLFAIRPHELRRAAQSFISQFPGDVIYNARANRHNAFLHALHAGGVRHFTAATLEQLRTVKNELPDAAGYFLHPVKSATAIFEAAHQYGVTHFGIDHIDELAKIIVRTTPLKPTIVVRLAVPRDLAVYDPTGKFGASVTEAAALMRAAAAEGLGIGLDFRLGSQSLDPTAWFRALALTGSVVETANLHPELINVGGGFPVANRGKDVRPLADYFTAIREGLALIRLHYPVRLTCTPGRALAAVGASLVLKVEMRRDNRLYLNDSTQGSMAGLRIYGSDAPMRVWRINGGAQLVSSARDDFSFYGSDDGADLVAGPFLLPADIRIGDYIEIGQMGGAGNSFLSLASVIVNDPAFIF